MAPPTRSNPFKTPSPEPLANKEATTTRKCRYFDAMRRDRGVRSRRAIAADCGITEGTARNWDRKYKEIGSLALRRTRLRSAILGHKSKVTKSMCKLLVSPSRNPVRKQPYEVQIQYHNLPVGKRQLQRMMKRNTKGGGRYKCAFVKKQISPKNKEEREKYGHDHKKEPLHGFWDHIVFTDKAHVDPTSQAQGMITRERGKRDAPENIKERPPLKGVRFHVAGWIS
ncbi:uncharacterized protein LY89DRAFT_396661 [Mollisia scopiformis]|uniref:Transposase n=1 Tax=Mollisia scopiformis TaxID=149040 RepID=A0A132B4D8_MOLSC|nr:uncharacterized protein LY89DRAFT_396661 [Mollisia scopiformis]KUJ06774.1 hypothetical protein LY89DRAFT_396661 [Mollisia scopiformis]